MYLSMYKIMPQSYIYLATIYCVSGLNLIVIICFKLIICYSNTWCVCVRVCVCVCMRACARACVCIL